MPTTSLINLDTPTEERLPSTVRDFLPALCAFDFNNNHKESPDSPEPPVSTGHDELDPPPTLLPERHTPVFLPPVSPQSESHTPVDTPPLLHRESIGASSLHSLSSLDYVSEDGSDFGLD